MDDSSNEIYDRVASLLDEVDARLDEGHADEGLELALQAQKLLERNPEVKEKEVDLRIDTHYLLAASQFELGDIAAALREYEVVRKLDASDRRSTTGTRAPSSTRGASTSPEAMLALHKPKANTRAASSTTRRCSPTSAATAAKRRSSSRSAAKENPDEYPEPVRMPEAEVHSMLEDVLEALPRDVRRALDGVDLTLVPLPDPKIHASPDVDPLVLGVYRGVNLLEKSNLAAAAEIDRIEIFQRNVERVVNDKDELREELSVTLLHEIGHHLGWDEDDLTARGLN